MRERFADFRGGVFTGVSLDIIIAGVGDDVGVGVRVVTTASGCELLFCCETIAGSAAVRVGCGCNGGGSVVVVVSCVLLSGVAVSVVGAAATIVSHDGGGGNGKTGPAVKSVPGRSVSDILCHNTDLWIRSSKKLLLLNLAAWWKGY